MNIPTINTKIEKMQCVNQKEEITYRNTDWYAKDIDEKITQQNFLNVAIKWNLYLNKIEQQEVQEK